MSIDAPRTPSTVVPMAKSIKWSWLALSCVSLLTGAMYLVTVDLTGPAAISQAQQAE